MKKIQMIIITLLLLISLLAIVLGTLLHEPLQSISLTLGAALIGSLIGIFTTKIPGIKQLSEFEILLDLKTPGFITASDDITVLNRKWALYHLTTYEGKKMWRQSMLDLSKYSPNNKLKGKCYDTLMDNKTKKIYNANAGIWGDKIIIILDGNDNESKQIMVFPFFNKSFKTQFSGYAFFETFDEQQVLSKCILAKYPIENNIGDFIGSLNEEYAHKLANIWASQIENKLVNVDI
jgi:hypothetical protein